MSERLANDAYYTPQGVAEACVRTLVPHIAPNTSILEPHAGGGSFVRALRSAFPEAALYATDIDAAAAGLEDARTSGGLGLQQDFLSSFHQPSWVVGNPPYANALDHVEHALSCAKVGVAFLLRLAFLEGRVRAEFFKENPPLEVHVLVSRPSFAWGRTDGAAYGFFIWKHAAVNNHTSLHWLDWKTG